MFMTGCVRGG